MLTKQQTEEALQDKAVAKNAKKQTQEAKTSPPLKMLTSKRKKSKTIPPLKMLTSKRKKLQPKLSPPLKMLKSKRKKPKTSPPLKMLTSKHKKPQPKINQSKILVPVNKNMAEVLKYLDVDVSSDDEQELT